jgi:hypothetical protein
MLRELCSLAIGAGMLTAVMPVAYGQAAATNGEIIGVVTDAAGAAVADAAVQVANTATAFTQNGRTASSGLYRFTLLPIGEYDLTVKASGFADARVTGTVLNAGAVVTVNVTLQVEGTTSQVDVVATGGMIEPGRTAFGTVLDHYATSNLPLVSRNPYNFILFQPNVSGRANTEFGVPRKINANGFNGRINYQLDGSNNTESDRSGIRLIPISISYVQEVGKQWFRARVRQHRWHGVQHGHKIGGQRLPRRGDVHLPPNSLQRSSQVVAGRCTYA